MSSGFNLSKPNRPIRIGVLLMNGETEILDVGPVDLIHGIGKHFVNRQPDFFVPEALKSQALDLEFLWVAEKSTPRTLTSGISLNPTHDFSTCPPLDIVLIGAHETGYEPNEAELAYARKAFYECAVFMTVCGGMLVPLQAGLLEGRKATGPRPFLPELRQKAPGTEWLDKRWVRDGKLWTSGALLNGLDMVHAFMKETWPGELTDIMSSVGAFPARDVDYKDVDA